MSKSSLAYIDSHVERMLSQEVQSPTPHSADVARANQPRIIAGFEVADRKQTERLIDEARERRRERVSEYREHRSHLLEIVRETGAEPLAVLPKAMFDLICKQSGLYYVPKSLRTEVNPTHFLTWLRTPEGQVVDSSLWTGNRPLTMKEMRKGKHDKTPEAYIEEFGREIVLRHLLTLDHTTFETEDQEVERLVQESRGQGEWGGFITRSEVRSLLGRPQSSPTDGRKYDIVLPVPPEDVCETLIRVADLAPQTVCVYGAVDLRAPGIEGLPSVLHQAKKDREERDERVKERVDWRLHDPIVYLTRGSVVAVMAQFGPFPVEQAIVDRITAAEFLPQ